MSALQDMAREIARRPPPQLLPLDRMTATERAAAQLENRRIGGPQRVAPDPEMADAVEGIDAAGLRRLLATLWTDPRWTRAAARVVARARDIGDRSLDRAIIHAYLRVYPVRHVAFDALRAAAATASQAHDWAWSARGDRWALWTPEGPGLVRDAIASDTIADPALVRLLAGSAFLEASAPR